MVREWPLLVSSSRTRAHPCRTANRTNLKAYGRALLRGACSHAPTLARPLIARCNPSWVAAPAQFLISQGHAFVRRLVFRASAPFERPRHTSMLTITPDVVGGFLAFRQGMRLQYDATRRQVGTAVTSPSSSLRLLPSAQSRMHESKERERPLPRACSRPIIETFSAILLRRPLSQPRIATSGRHPGGGDHAFGGV